MAEPGMASVPPGFQVHVQKINQRLAKVERELEHMKSHWDDMARRVAALEVKRRPGRPRKEEAV